MCQSKGKHYGLLLFLLFSILACHQVLAQETSNEELAKKLSNPISSLISVPFQLNYDSNIGVADTGDRFTLNIQPVVPLELNEDWNMISRTILPVSSQSDIFAGSGSQFGIGDIVQSVFFSPKKPTANGWIWGAGPVFLVPTASNDLLGGQKWGAGPTAVALKQNGAWTIGALANHIWSYAGSGQRADINNTFLQPFVSYTTPTAISITFNTESTYNWDTKEWAVPLNLSVTKVTKIGGQLVSVGAGVRYWVKSSDTGPEGFGVRLLFTLLFPK